LQQFSPRYNLMQLALFVILSLMLHTVLALTLPDLTRYFNVHLSFLSPSDRLIEVALVDKKIPPPSPPHPKAVVPHRPPAAEPGNRFAGLVEARIKKFAPVASLGDAPLLPAPPLELPAGSRLDDADFDALLLPATNDAARLQERLGKMNNLAFGELQGRRRSRPAVSARPVTSPVAALLSPAARQQLLSLGRPEKKALAEELGLSGPIARERRVLYRPSLPRVTLAREVVVRMRFWVRPDGSVNRIGDLELVNAAQKYLQQWRFSTLPPEVPQTEQWGQLTVIFRVSQ